MNRLNSVRLRYSIHLYKIFTIVSVLMICTNGHAQLRCQELFGESGQQSAVSSRNAVADVISRTFRSLFRPKSYVGTSLDLPSDVYTELRIAQDFIHEFYRTLERPYINVPEAFSLNGKNFEVVLRLGGGTEGEVFLVRSEHELFAIKQFYHASQMRSNILLARKMLRRGLPVLQPIEVDANRGIAVYPYIDGIDVGVIFRPWSLDNNTAAPISKRTQEFIEEKYEEFIREYRERHNSSAIDNNVVFDLQNRRFVIIDPR